MATADVALPGADEVRWAPMSLADLAGRTIDHHLLPVPVDRRLRGGAFVGLGLVGALTAVVGAGSGLGRSPRPGVLLFGWRLLRGVLWSQPQATLLFWAGILTFSAGVAGAAFTRGFSRVRPSLLLAVFGLVLLGCVAAVPLLVAGLILLANIAIWVAVGMVCLALAVALILTCLAAIGT